MADYTHVVVVLNELCRKERENMLEELLLNFPKVRASECLHLLENIYSLIHFSNYYKFANPRSPIRLIIRTAQRQVDNEHT